MKQLSYEDRYNSLRPAIKDMLYDKLDELEVALLREWLKIRNKKRIKLKSARVVSELNFLTYFKERYSKGLKTPGQTRLEQRIQKQKDTTLLNKKLEEVFNESIKAR